MLLESIFVFLFWFSFVVFNFRFQLLFSSFSFNSSVISSPEAIDASTNELNEFVENLTMQQLEMITDYFNSIPALQHDVESKCTTCDKDIRTTVKGLNSFF